MADPQIRVTVVDLATGDTETRDLTDDYVLICAGTAEMTYVTEHANGTHQITVKRPSKATSVETTLDAQS